MFMVAGLKYGYTDPKDNINKQKHYELIQKLAGLFTERNGSIVCRELLGLDMHIDTPKPEERTVKYYKRRPCTELVRSAVEIIDSVIYPQEGGHDN